MSAMGGKLTLERCRDCARFGPAMTDRLYDEATEVAAEDGEVILDGPDGVHVRITPEAAEKIADNLIEGAGTALGQMQMKEIRHRPK